METSACAISAEPPVPPTVFTSDEVFEENTPETGRTALAHFANPQDFFNSSKARVGVIILSLCDVFLINYL